MRPHLLLDTSITLLQLYNSQSDNCCSIFGNRAHTTQTHIHVQWLMYIISHQTERSTENETETEWTKRTYKINKCFCRTIDARSTGYTCCWLSFFWIDAKQSIIPNDLFSFMIRKMVAIVVSNSGIDNDISLECKYKGFANRLLMGKNNHSKWLLLSISFFVIITRKI